jgi:hypothetical protein
MNKFYCIEPATKDKDGVCVLPTMQEPLDWPGFYEVDTDVLNHYNNKRNVWEAHLASLPKFPTSCDRVGWFEGEEQLETPLGSAWYRCNKWVYDNAVRRGANVRKFIVPQSEEKPVLIGRIVDDFENKKETFIPASKEKDLASVPNDSSPVATLRSTKGNSDEQWISVKDKLPDYDHLAIWLMEDGTAFVEMLDKDGNPWLYGRNASGAKVSHWMPLPKMPNSEQKAQECDARKADQGTEAGKQNPVEQKDEPKEEWDSNRIIGRVKDRFKELEAKGWDWRSFYNGWLEGRTDMFSQIKEIGKHKPSNEQK